MGIDQINNNEQQENLLSGQEQTDVNTVNASLESPTPEVDQATRNMEQRVDAVLDEPNNPPQTVDVANSIDDVINTLQLDRTNPESYANNMQTIRDFMNNLWDMDNWKKIQIISKLAQNLWVSYNTLLAMTYTETPTQKQLDSQATEIWWENAWGDAFINVSKVTSYTEYYRQWWNIEINNEVITWAVLDFTWSMKTDQLQWMLMAMQNLAQQWIINENTTFNIMYNISDMEWWNFNTGNIINNQNKTENIQYGPNGEWLKNLLLKLWLINVTPDGKWNIKEWVRWLGSTPLYDTILKNLMSSSVRDCVVFTDWSSDSSATKWIWDEELWNTEAWDQMIRLCKEYNKTIKIVVFNPDAEHMARLQKMKEYFGDNYLSINTQENTDGQPLWWENLSNWIQNSLVNNMDNTTIRVSEDPNVANHQINVQVSNDWPDTTQTQVPNDLPNTFDGIINFDWSGYNINLQEIFGQGIDFSQYDLSYNIFSQNMVEWIVPVEVLNINKWTWIFDLSASMWVNRNNIKLIADRYKNWDTYFFRWKKWDLNKIESDTLNTGGWTPLFDMINSLDSHKFKDSEINIYTDCANSPETWKDINSKKLKTLLDERWLTLNIYDSSKHNASPLTDKIMDDIYDLLPENTIDTFKNDMIDDKWSVKWAETLKTRLESLGEKDLNQVNPLLVEYWKKWLLKEFRNFVYKLAKGKNNAAYYHTLDGGIFDKDFVENHIFNWNNWKWKIKIMNSEKFDSKWDAWTMWTPIAIPGGYTRDAMTLTLTPKPWINAPVLKKNLKINTPA